jgi:hypothetical protein
MTLGKLKQDLKTQVHHLTQSSYQEIVLPNQLMVTRSPSNLL